MLCENRVNFVRLPLGDLYAPLSRLLEYRSNVNNIKLNFCRFSRHRNYGYGSLLERVNENAICHFSCDKQPLNCNPPTNEINPIYHIRPLLLAYKVLPALYSLLHNVCSLVDPNGHFNKRWRKNIQLIMWIFYKRPYATFRFLFSPWITVFNVQKPTLYPDFVT